MIIIQSNKNDILELTTDRLSLLLQMLLVQIRLERLRQKATAPRRVLNTEEPRVWTARTTTTKVKQKCPNVRVVHLKAIKHTSVGGNSQIVIQAKFMCQSCVFTVSIK